jgi:hypothetical protein
VDVKLRKGRGADVVGYDYFEACFDFPRKLLTGWLEVRGLESLRHLKISIDRSRADARPLRHGK